MNIALLAAVGVLAIANAVVSIAVLRSPAYDSRQKSFQLVLLWLLPILGVVVVWSFLRGTESERVTTDLASRSEGAVGGIPDHVNLHSDAADLGGFGGGHEGS